MLCVKNELADRPPNHGRNVSRATRRVMTQQPMEFVIREGEDYEEKCQRIHFDGTILGQVLDEPSRTLLFTELISMRAEQNRLNDYCFNMAKEDVQNLYPDEDFSKMTPGHLKKVELFLDGIEDMPPPAEAVRALIK